jgi:hypothetical protein
MTGPADPFERDDPTVDALDHGLRLFAAIVALDDEAAVQRAITSLSKDDLRCIVFERVTVERDMRRSP